MQRLGKTSFCTAVLCALLAGAHAQELRIRIPDSSGMHLYAPDNYTSLVSFAGQAQLQGHLLLVSQSETIDDEVEWRVALLFKPDPSEHDKLPQVRYADESAEQGERLIELNFFQKDQIADVVETIFGAEVAAKLGKEALQTGKHGLLGLESYRTGIECDRRYHYAHIVSFESQKDLQASQVRKLVEALPLPCS